MYQDISIKHFRGFESLTIEGLSQVNVFVGRNNSGKTSILEAIFLLGGRENGLVPGMLGIIRGFHRELLPHSIAYLWHRLNYDAPISIESESKDIRYRQELELFPIFEDKDKLEEHLMREGVTTTTGRKYPSGVGYKGLSGVRHKVAKYQYSELDEEEYKDIPNIEGDYLPSNRLDANTPTNFRRIVEVGLKDKLIAFLSSFDKRVVGVELIGEEILIRLEGLEYLMPLQIAGDGLRRFVSVWSAVANPDNEVVLIDEVDNGIHHSSYRLLWEMILRTAKENNVQLFITTHSDESLFGLAEANENLADGEGAEAAIYSVAHTKSGVKVYRYEVANYEQVREGHVDPRN